MRNVVFALRVYLSYSTSDMGESSCNFIIMGFFQLNRRVLEP